MLICDHNAANSCLYFLDGIVGLERVYDDG